MVGRVQRAPVIRGYHGTSATHAAGILRDGFRPSGNDYDCLGDGVYFFEDGPAQARATSTNGLNTTSSGRMIRP